MRTYEELTKDWNELLECLRDHEKPDLETIQRLIFETYHFAKKEIKGNSIPRNRLKLYKCIGQFCESLEENYPEGMKASVSETCRAFAKSLCHVIENGFDRGYVEEPLYILMDMHIPAGCEPPRADMATYESYIAEFQDNVEWLREMYGEDEE